MTRIILLALLAAGACSAAPTAPAPRTFAPPVARDTAAWIPPVTVKP